MNEVNGGNGAQGPDPGSGGSGAWASPGSASGQPGGSSGPGGWGGPGRSGKRLVRKLEGRWIAGVCAGLGDYLGVDANLIRVILVGLVVFGGFGALAYVIAWALVPEEGESASIAEKIINKSGTSGGQG